MKTKTTHTLGPWTYECTNAGEIGSKDKVRVEGPDGHIAIACRVKRTEKNTFGNVGIPRGLPEVKANARLIAAAPDLLQALKGIIELGKRDTSNPKYDGYFLAAVEAIAKAEGR